MRIAAGFVVLVALVACHPQAAPPDAPHGPAPVHRSAAHPNITWQRIASLADVPTTPPPAGTWRIHMIDVGTGLSILIQGADFALLYDAGSNDPSEKPLRVLDYLAAALGPSGDSLCVEPGAPAPTTRRRIDHVVLSHPHFDHASALDLVLHCYQASNVWDSGRVNDAVFYRDFLEAVSHDDGATYHTAAPPASDRTRTVKGIDVVIPPAVTWTSFSEGDVVTLGDRARFTILHAEAKAVRDINDNSTVLLVELGGARLLLTGDAGSGKRADPSAAVGAVEEYLLDEDGPQLHADILQVGHHGSKTSSRAAFLAAVAPTLALVSTGPRAYGHTVLPDAEVIDALTAVGATVLRTDEHDATCPHGPGGCDSFLVTITTPP